MLRISEQSSNSTQIKKSSYEPKTEARKTGKYYISKGETLYNIAQNFNMTVEELKKKTNLKSNSIQAGQLIDNLPTIKVKAGQGLSRIAKDNGMTLAAFLKLNGINENYVPQPDEIFFVAAKQSTSKPAAPKTTKTEKKSPETASSTQSNIDKNTKVKLTNGKTFTAEQLKQSAIDSGKNDPNLRGCKNPYLVRPLPNIVNGKIEAECELKTPLKKGPLNGKIIILNPGHGGYQQENGFFDPGTICTTKNDKGQKIPVEEWRVAQDYVDTLASKLRGQGANVIIVKGAVKNGGMASQKYIENLIKGLKGSDDVKKLMKKTSHSNMLLMSVHVEAKKERPHDKGCSVIGQKGDSKDALFAKNIQNSLRSGFSTLTPATGARNLYVTRAAGSDIPAVLLEIGNIANEDIQASLLSAYDQNKYMECIAEAIVKTLK